jgi:OST-HTH/LOTUS domain
VDDASDESGWANLGAVGSILTKKEPDFDSRNYGYSKLSDLLEASKHFEIKRQDKAISVRRAR